jgi:hypothetical protein
VLGSQALEEALGAEAGEQPPAQRAAALRDVLSRCEALLGPDLAPLLPGSGPEAAEPGGGGGAGPKAAGRLAADAAEPGRRRRPKRSSGGSCSSAEASAGSSDAAAACLSSPGEASGQGLASASVDGGAEGGSRRGSECGGRAEEAGMAEVSGAGSLGQVDGVGEWQP